MDWLPSFVSTLFERDKNGDSWYFLDGARSWSKSGSNLYFAQNHPILSPALLFVSKLFSQAEFKIINTKNGEEVKKHWLIDLLKKPNYYQTHSDFLESLMFMEIAQGKGVLYAKKTIGFKKDKDTEAFYILNSDLITYPDDFKTPMMLDRHEEAYGKQEIIYDKDKTNVKIKIKDLLFFYDMPNCTQENFFESASRLDGLKQTLINTNDSLLAKNIILKTNGKELITGKDGDFLLDDDEKRDAEELFNGNYGLSLKRKRALITKANLQWKSLHIAIRDLGLDESVKVDGNLIYTALHIPKDILSLEAKKTTYNNFKESMVSYIQNEMQSSVDAFSAVMQELIEEPHFKLVGNYDNMPIMQFILIEKYEGVEQRGVALTALRSAGLPDDVALELTGFDKTTVLTELKPMNNENNGKEKRAIRRALENQQNGEEERELIEEQSTN